jgi:hypothetical protein
VLEMVVGDVIQVRFGDHIQGDTWIIKTSGFEVGDSLTPKSNWQSCSPGLTYYNSVQTKNLSFSKRSCQETTVVGTRLWWATMLACRQGRCSLPMNCMSPPTSHVCHESGP